MTFEYSELTDPERKCDHARYEVQSLISRVYFEPIRRAGRLSGSHCCVQSFPVSRAPGTRRTAQVIIISNSELIRVLFGCVIVERGLVAVPRIEPLVIRPKSVHC